MKEALKEYFPKEMVKPMIVLVSIFAFAFIGAAILEMFCDYLFS